MPYSCPARRLLFATVTLALFAFVAASAHAVEMEVIPGFDGVVKSAVWSPIGVKLTNPGGRTIEGTLEVQQDAPNRRTMPVCSAKVSLPGNSTKLYYVYTRRQEYGGGMRVALMHGSRTVVSKNVTPATISRFDRLVVSIGDRSSRLHFLAGEKVPLTMSGKSAAQAPSSYSSSGQTDSTIQATSLSPIMLPDRPAAYQSVDVMVISDMGSTSPDPKALKAISMWVAGGGTLVVSTGPNFRNFQTDFYDDLLPVAITGASSVPTLSAFASIGKLAFPGGPVAVATSIPKPGICTQVFREGAIPVYAERRYGAGRVIFFAFDCKASPFRDWNGQTEFWKSVVITSNSGAMMAEDLEWMLDPRGRMGRSGSSALVTGLRDVVAQNPAVKTPSFNVIALYLLAYLIFLVPLNYLFVKKKGRMEIAWVSTPVIVLVFTLGAYAIGYTMKGGRIEMGVATVIEGSANSRYARTISDASLFSPARRSYDVEMKDPYAIGQCIPQEISESMPPAYLGEKTTIEKIDMAMWSNKVIETVSGIDLGGTIESGLSLDMSGGSSAANKVKGTITNNTKLDLRNCRIQFSGNQQYIGDLPRGRTKKIYGSNSTGLPTKSGYFYDVQSKLSGLADVAASRLGMPVLIGFVDMRSPYGLADRRSKNVNVTCCLFHLGVDMGSARIFPLGAIRGKIGTTQNARSASQPAPGAAPSDATMVLSPGGYFLTSFQMPDGGSVEPVSFTVSGKSGYPYHGNGQPRVQYYLVTSSGSWEPIPAQVGPIANPAKYLRPGYRIVVKAQSADSQEITVSVGVSAVGKRK